MSKVKILKRMLNKLAGENVASDSDQTVCDVLSDMEKYIVQSGGAIQTTYNKWAVVVVAGQSNAVGYDESAPTLMDIPKDKNRIKQLGYKGDNNLKIVDLTYCAENFQDMSGLGYMKKGSKGMHLPLANALLDCVPEDYGVLVLPCAFGGSAFGSGGTYDAETMKVPTSQNNCKWGSQANLYYATRDRLKKVLDENEENIFLGVVWLQGEFGASNPTANNDGFDAMVNQFNTDFASYAKRTRKGVIDKSLWFPVQTTYYWYTGSNKAGCEQIWAHYKEWAGSNFVDVPLEENLTNMVRNVAGGEAWNTTTSGQVSSAYGSHYGNNAFSTTVVPRIIRVMKSAGVLFDNDDYEDFGKDTTELETKAYELRGNTRTLSAALTSILAKVNELAEAASKDTLDVNTKALSTMTIDDIKKGYWKTKEHTLEVANGVLTIGNAGGAGANMLSADITHFEGTTNGKNFVFLVTGDNNGGLGMFAQAVSSNNFYYAKADGDAGFSNKTISGYTAARSLDSARFVIDIVGTKVTAKLGDQTIFDKDVSSGIGGDTTYTTPRIGIGASWSQSNPGTIVFTDCKVS